MTNSIGESTVLCTEDPVLHESVMRVAAVADVDIVVHQRLSDARGSWSSAPVILLGSDAVSDALILGLPRRAGVVIVTMDDGDLWRCAVELGAQAVVTLPGDDAQLIGLLVDRDHTSQPPAPVVVVTGGCGGAGASHLAVAIAQSAATHCARGALLIDADDLGGGLELLVELENAPGLRWRDLSAIEGRVPPDALRGALPHVDDMHLLSHDRQSTVVEPQTWDAILDAGSRGYGLTVVDAARDCSPTVMNRARLTVVVVPADLRSVAAAAARIAVLQQHARDVRIVIRHRRDSDLDRTDVSAALESPIAGEYSDHKPVSVERISEVVVASLGVSGRLANSGRRRMARRGGRRAA
jgi:secretion/DNA translocation related CpaE-like protein